MGQPPDRRGARGSARCGPTRDALRGSVLGVTAPAWHHRALSWDAGRGLLRCRDHAVPGAPATARYFLPGDVELTARPGGWRARTTGGQVFTITSDPPLRRERELAPGWRGFNEAAPRHCLLAPVPSAGLEVQFAREATPVNRVF
ncbi:MAG: hypothetical protein H6713_18990 [Myxococcales bacterium]|nr:hypothetical protein [Myxococcales bacterium]